MPKRAIAVLALAPVLAPAAGGISERGRASHDEDAKRYPGPIERSFVVGGRLYTLSQFGLEANSLDNLAEQAFLPFPR